MEVLNLYSRGRILKIAIFEGNSLKLDSDSTNLLRFAGNSFSKRRHGKKPLMEHGELWSFPYLWQFLVLPKGFRISWIWDLGRCFAKGTDPQKGTKTKRRWFGMRLSQIRALQKVASQRSITAACTVGQNWTSRASDHRPAASHAMPSIASETKRETKASWTSKERRSSDVARPWAHTSTPKPRKCRPLAQISRHMVCTDSTPATRRQGSRVPRL